MPRTSEILSGSDGAVRSGEWSGASNLANQQGIQRTILTALQREQTVEGKALTPGGVQSMVSGYIVARQEELRIIVASNREGNLKQIAQQELNDIEAMGGSGEGHRSYIHKYWQQRISKQLLEKYLEMLKA